MAEGQVIRHHPRMVNRWAVRYIKLYRTAGPEEAKKWALEFLPAPERQLMVEKVNKILHRGKRGN